MKVCFYHRLTCLLVLSWCRLLTAPSSLLLLSICEKQVSCPSFDLALTDLELTMILNYRETAETADNGTSPWLAGVRLDAFEGDFGVQVASAAHAIGADILSPADIASSVVDPTLPEYVPFTTREMVVGAHNLGMLVKPWTVRLFSS